MKTITEESILSEIKEKTCDTIEELDEEDEESILSEIIEKTCDTIEELDEEDDDEEEEDLVPPPSIKEALNMAKKLQHFMMCQEDGGESYGALTKIHSYIMDKSLANAKQLKISDFFKTAS